MFKTTAMIFSVIFILQGCASSSVNQDNPANVTSNPSGAAVFANGLEIGKTPLRANLYDTFPAGWKDWVYQAQGVLMVKMDGCKDYTLKVTDLILSKPIHAELECSQASKPEKSTAIVSPQKETPPIVSPQTVTSPIVTTGSNTEKRLEELEALHKKGVITEAEYKKTRERILNEL